MKAALEASGASSNLFHQGFAKEVDDDEVNCSHDRDPSNRKAVMEQMKKSKGNTMAKKSKKKSWSSLPRPRSKRPQRR
jgi:hypothetical protein